MLAGADEVDAGGPGRPDARPSPDLPAVGDRGPLEWPGVPEGAGRRIDVLIWAFVGLGIAIRLFRYAMNFPLWGDEAFVAVNFIARGYRDLLRPLDYGQICPLLFLWVERFVVARLGFSEWTLRLFPMICGVASVLLFRHVAGQVARGLPLLLASAIFAVSLHPIRHAAEVKPYASDLLVALVLLALALRWRRTPEQTRWLWLLVAAVPWALALSHPALFVAGGIGLALAPPIVRRRRPGEWVPFLLYQLAMVGTFLGLFFLMTRYQEQLALEGLRIYWAGAFPPRDGPVALLRWLVDVHTGTMFAYPGGGRNGASTATFLAVVAGSFVLWRRGRRGVLVLLLSPFALSLAAAALRRYPYGSEARQMQFVAPAICLLAGLGMARLWQALPGPRARRAFATLAVFLLAGFGVDLLRRDLARPYRFLHDHQARQFARRFWPEQARHAELACVNADFDVANRRTRNLRIALYLCNQWIYSPQRRRPRVGPRPDALGPDRPLRCMLYDETRPDHPEVVAWLARMQHSFVLRGVDRVAIDASAMHVGSKAECLTVFEFVPKAREARGKQENESIRR